MKRPARHQLTPGLLTLALVMAVICGSCRKPDSAETSAASWVRHDKKARLIVFVHGVLGAPRDTWTNAQTGAYFPDLVASDSAFADADIFVVGFPSPSIRTSYSIDQLTEKVYRDLKANGALDYQDIVFVSHSMGGIVARAFVLKYEDVRPKVKMMQFFSTPFAGADLASFASALSRSTQFDGMRDIVDNTYLQSQQSSWNAAGLSTSIKSFCAYELRPTFGKMIVTLQSATLICNQRLDPIDANHIDIVKPKDGNDDSFLALKIAYSGVYLISDYTPLTQANLANHLGALAGAGPLRSFSIAEPIDLSSLVRDPQRWTVLNLRFEGKGALNLGEIDLSLTVRGRLVVPEGRPTVVASGWPGKPLPPRSADGNAGANGAAGSGHNGQDGDSGQAGGPGQPGQEGAVGARSGDLSIVLSDLPTAAFRVALIGQNGGPGGNGGAGGNGGRGESGRSGRSGVLRCDAGGGDGGRGGNGGRGGDAGPGGACGRGGTLTIVVPQRLRSRLLEEQWIEIDTSVANAGKSGQAGTGGGGGSGGGMGSGNGFCRGGHGGGDGGGGPGGSVLPPGPSCPAPTIRVEAPTT